jgi:hypothetical protein
MSGREPRGSQCDRQPRLPIANGIVWTAEGRFYVTAVVDLFCRRVVGCPARNDLDLGLSLKIEQMICSTYCSKVIH